MIPPDACTLGWQESLTLLAKLVEAETRTETVNAPDRRKIYG